MKIKIKKLLFLVLLLNLVSVSAILVWILNLDIPDFSAFEFRKSIQSTKIFDREQKVLLYDIHQDIKRTKIPFEEIPRHLNNATVAIEDSNFYNHPGFNSRSVIRAVWTNIKTREFRQGASTITQQLVKTSLLSPEKTFSRKFKEIILAIKIEKKYSKEDILNFYLNETYYGSSSFGIEAASQTFFGKTAKELTLAESAYLASLPKAPSYYSPYGNHRDELEHRKNLVLEKMLELNFIDGNEQRAAKEERVVFRNLAKEGLLAPHFVMYVRDYLISKYGKEAVEQEGLNVITTLDFELQSKAEEFLKKWTAKQERQFNAKNAGLVSINPQTGEILTMVGSADYFNLEKEGNFNVTLGLRQPGSALKPFVYAELFQKGYMPNTIFFDLFTEFNPECDPNGLPAANLQIKKQNLEDFCYHPQNYDNQFRGPVIIRDALAQSINIPAVKALYLAGLNNVLKNLKDMGINTLKDPDRYGLSLVLGGGEVQLLELTGAYSVFANKGLLNPITAILRVENSQGEILEEFKNQEKRVLEENIVLMINDILSDNSARAPTFGLSSYLFFPEYPDSVAVKTGTTDDFRDAWVIGYTQNFTLGVWFGNNDNSPMEKKVAGFIAAPLWNEFFREVFKKYPPAPFDRPEETKGSKPVLNGEWRGGRVYLIDKISQKRATDYTPPEYLEEKLLTEVHSILYWLDKQNPNGPIPQSPENDFQFRNWEASVRKWALERNIKDENPADIPQEFDDVHKPEYKPKISILNENEILDKESKILKLNISATSFFPVQKIEIFLGWERLGEISKQPYVFEHNLSLIKNLPGEEQLIIRAFDEKGNTGELIKLLNF